MTDIFNDSSTQTQANGMVARLVDDVVERACNDLRGQVPSTLVRQYATELLAQYRDPVVTVFIPILVRRQLRDRLRAELRTDLDNQVAFNDR